MMNSEQIKEVIKGGNIMLSYEWIDFSTDTDFYNQATFEEKIGDQFEALFLERNKAYPSMIWTKHYVILLKNTSRMYQDLTFIKIARNPTQELTEIHFF